MTLDALQYLHDVVFSDIVMSGNSSSGLEIIQIVVSDQKSISTGSIRYDIVSTEYVRGTEVSQGSSNATIRDTFMIDPDTGKVGVSAGPSPHTYQGHTVPLLAALVQSIHDVTCLNPHQERITCERCIRCTCTCTCRGEERKQTPNSVEFDT